MRSTTQLKSEYEMCFAFYMILLVATSIRTNLKQELLYEYEIKSVSNVN